MNKIATSPDFYDGTIEIDTTHQIAEKVQANGSVSYFPMYWSCGAWRNYTNKGQIVEYSSIPAGTVNAHQASVRHVRRSMKQQEDAPD